MQQCFAEFVLEQDAAETTLKKMISSYTKWAETGGPEEDFVNSSRSGNYPPLIY